MANLTKRINQWAANPKLTSTLSRNFSTWSYTYVIMQISYLKKEKKEDCQPDSNFHSFFLYSRRNWDECDPCFSDLTCKAPVWMLCMSLLLGASMEAIALRSCNSFVERICCHLWAQPERMFNSMHSSLWSSYLHLIFEVEEHKLQYICQLLMLANQSPFSFQTWELVRPMASLHCDVLLR